MPTPATKRRWRRPAIAASGFPGSDSGSFEHTRHIPPSTPGRTTRGSPCCSVRRAGVRLKVMAIGGAVLAFLTVGAIGVFRYADTFWLYRGFPPPSVPKAVAVTRGGVTSRVSVSPGTTETFTLASPALGGRSQVVYVFLPPGYFTDPTKHYPVLYLLLGHPGRPLNFLL